MGDSRRFIVFADWIEKQFPVKRFTTIADIAGGSGELSRWLCGLGYQCTVYDVRRYVWQNKPFARESRDVEKLHFRPGQFSLVVGLHPDGATWHCIRLASEARCPFAIVPCCKILPKGIKLSRDYFGWLVDEATRIGFGTWVTQLRMDGMNKLIKGWPEEAWNQAGGA